eukprot:13243953-Alexandrium_andersonii.AAC.1
MQAGVVVRGASHVHEARVHEMLVRHHRGEPGGEAVREAQGQEAQPEAQWPDAVGLRRGPGEAQWPDAVGAESGGVPI